MYKRLVSVKQGDRTIKNLLDREKGRDIVVLGNGPSLKKVDFSKLVNPIVIGLNGSCIYTNQHGIDDDYYVLSDMRFVSDPVKMDMLKKNLSPKARLVVRKELEPSVLSYLDNPLYSVRALGRDGFSEDLHRGYFFGCTTVMLGIQLAYYLGGSRVFVCGVDLKYDPVMPRFYKEKNVHEIDNFSCVQIHNIRQAYTALSLKGRHLYNVSKESLLKPYLPYYEL